MNTKYRTSLSIDEHFFSDNKGLFLIPSDNTLQQEDNETIITCANEYGKLQHTQVSSFLELSDLNYDEIRIRYPKDNQVLTFCENNKWMNKYPPPLKKGIYYNENGFLKPCPIAYVSDNNNLIVKGTLSVDSIFTKNCGTIVVDCSGKLEFVFKQHRIFNIIHYTGEYITDGIPSIQVTDKGFKIINLHTNKLKGQVTVCFLEMN